MKEDEDALNRIPHKYQIKRITHLPDTQATISDVKEIKHHSLAESRKIAMQEFRKELESLEGQYSPESYRTYDPERGVGYNLALFFVDEREEGALVIESSFYDNDKVVHDREVEKKIFMKLGVPYPEEAE